jgi:hypothetical protein
MLSSSIRGTTHNTAINSCWDKNHNIDVVCNNQSTCPIVHFEHRPSKYVSIMQCRSSKGHIILLHSSVHTVQIQVNAFQGVVNVANVIDYSVNLLLLIEAQHINCFLGFNKVLKLNGIMWDDSHDTWIGVADRNSLLQSSSSCM